MHVSLFQVNIALRCILHNHDNIAKEGTDLMPYSYRITSRVLYSAQCHRLYCTLHAFEQFGAPFRAIVGSNVPSRPPRYFKHKQSYSGSY